MTALIAGTAIIAVLAATFGVAWWFGRPRRIDDIDTETERMANLFTAEAMGEADWLANATGLSRDVTWAMAEKALERAAMKLRNRKHG
jgi:hypothetical protein